YRVHFLTALGLVAVPLAFLWQGGEWLLAVLLCLTLFACFAGSVVWSLEGAPAGRILTLAAVALLTVALGLTEHGDQAEAASSGASTAGFGWLLAGDLTSAALLGAATTAMLMGHSYLIAPAMSLTPLLRLLA